MTPETSKPDAVPWSELRILVVEDQFLVADEIRRTVKSLGATVLGPVPGIDGALALIEEREPDVAVLDFDLAGETSLPVAQELSRRTIPWLVVTGYGADMLPALLADAVRVEKPFTAETITAALQEALGRGRAG